MKIVAIGGGETGRREPYVRTTAIDREIVSLSGKKAPRFLFLPTASSGDDQYCAAIYKQFSRKLGCKVDILLLVNADPEYIEIKERILRADIIYVGEGNTLKMMKTWRRYGVDKALRAAARRGAVLCGSSAGSIAWFESGNSDSQKSESEPNRLIRVRGLGLIDTMVCPHYDAELHRRPSFRAMTRTARRASIGLDECCAIEVIDGSYRILSSVDGRGAYRVYWRGGEFVEEPIAETGEFRPLEGLFKLS
jgi:dipeptidase E